MSSHYIYIVNLSKKVVYVYSGSSSRNSTLVGTFHFDKVFYGAFVIKLRSDTSLLLIDLETDILTTPDLCTFQIVEVYKISDIWRFTLISRDLFNPFNIPNKYSLDEEN